MNDFCGTLNNSISESIRGLLGPNVVDTLYRILEEEYSVTSDELSYHLETLWEVLERGMGYVGSRTIGRSIAKLFYSRLGLHFIPYPGWRLQEYVEEAKKLSSLP